MPDRHAANAASSDQKTVFTNLLGEMARLKVGATGNTNTAYANFVLYTDDGRRIPVNAYGSAALKMIEGGLACDGTRIKVGGTFKTELRTNPKTGRRYEYQILHLFHAEPVQMH